MTKHRLLTAAVIAAGALAVVAAVQAAIPDGSGTIHACYSKASAPGSQPGALRVIDTALGQTCQISEGSLNWSQTGPPGPQGPQGPQGPKGATGPKGDKGDPGANAYFAGTGLNLSGGTTFNIQPGYRLPQGCGEGQSPAIASFAWTCSTPASSNESCSGGKFVNGVNSIGDITCSSPSVATSGADVWSAHTNSANAPEVAAGEIANISLPAGTYFVSFTGVAADEAGTNGDGDVAVYCWNSADGVGDLRTEVDGGSPASNLGDEYGPNIGISVSNIVTLSAPGVIDMKCASEAGIGSDVVEDATLTAIRVGTLH